MDPDWDHESSWHDMLGPIRGDFDAAHSLDALILPRGETLPRNIRDSLSATVCFIITPSLESQVCLAGQHRGHG